MLLVIYESLIVGSWIFSSPKKDQTENARIAAGNLHLVYLSLSLYFQRSLSLALCLCFISFYLSPSVFRQSMGR